MTRENSLPRPQSALPAGLLKKLANDYLKWWKLNGLVKVLLPLLLLLKMKIRSRIKELQKVTKEEEVKVHEKGGEDAAGDGSNFYTTNKKSSFCFSWCSPLEAQTTSC